MMREKCGTICTDAMKSLTMLRAVRIAVEAWWVYWSHDTGLPLATSRAVSNHSHAFDL